MNEKITAVRMLPGTHKKLKAFGARYNINLGLAIDALLDLAEVGVAIDEPNFARRFTALLMDSCHASKLERAIISSQNAEAELAALSDPEKYQKKLREAVEILRAGTGA